MSDTRDKEREIAAKIIGEHGPLQFSEEEADALRSIAQAWLGWQAVGRFMAGFQVVAKWIGWAVALYLLLKAGAIDWIKGIR